MLEAYPREVLAETITCLERLNQLQLILTFSGDMSVKPPLKDGPNPEHVFGILLWASIQEGFR